MGGERFETTSMGVVRALAHYPQKLDELGEQSPLSHLFDYRIAKLTLSPAASAWVAPARSSRPPATPPGRRRAGRRSATPLAGRCAPGRTAPRRPVAP